jgi:aspartyl-tRNA(Asn)/glutamyl-tRNA(Gln) amidotransferase subunit C
MSKQLSKNDIAALAQLARLEFNDEQLEKYKKDLNAILEYIEQLNNVDTEGLTPTQQVTGLKNVMRADEIRTQLVSPKDLRAISPNTEGNYIKVGRMV